MENIYKIILFSSLVIIFACKRSPQDTGREFMPDMYHSQAYETYTENSVFTDSMTARLPVKGTIPRGGYMPFHYENTPEEYERAGKELVNPIEKNEEVFAEGKRLYTIYCAVCHGGKGEGNGTIVERGVYPPPPDYAVRLVGMSQGKMFHAITYGKNLMGGYASQLNEEERWKVIHYIQQFAPKQTVATN